MVPKSLTTDIPSKSEHPIVDVAVVLVPGVSLNTLSNVLEPLRLLGANFKEREVSIAIHGCAPSLSTGVPGVEVSIKHSLSELHDRLNTCRKPQLVVFCSGPAVPLEYRNELSNLLRKCALRRTNVMAISGMVWLMAETSQLPDGKATLHWNSMQAFQERYPDVEMENALYVSDGKLTCCAGEFAAFDMMADYIRTKYSDLVSDTICNELLIPATRNRQTKQPGSQKNRLRNVPASLQKVATTMAENIEEPLRQSEIANMCGISQRQIERLFQKYLFLSPAKYYQSLRLDIALQLVEQTNLPIMEIAMATGFSSPSTLAKRFKEAFGKSPSEARNELFQKRCG